MLYSYKGINLQGKTISGQLDAANDKVAARQLRKENLQLIELKPAPAVVARRSSSKPDKADDLQLVIYQFCALLESGVSLEVAVSSIADSTPNQQTRDAFKRITKAVRGGQAFSLALRESGLDIPGYFFSLGESGEMTGQLPQALRRGVDQWSYELETEKEVRNALTYPSILVVSGISAVILIFVMVVPKFTNLLDKADGDLPLLALIVLGSGKFFNENMLLIGAAVGLAVLLGVTWYSKPPNRHQFRQRLYAVPMVGAWLIEAAIARWASLLGTLLENRVELTQALRLAEKDVEYESMKGRLQQVERSVRAGEKLAESLQANQVVTEIGFNLVKVGEQSGQLPRMLETLAGMHISQGKQRMRKFLQLIEPVSILLIGAAVGFIMGGVILAITSVNDVAL
ncbi:MAG: type II secretion system F family protein [Halieaceae bacterium]